MADSTELFHEITRRTLMKWGIIKYQREEIVNQIRLAYVYYNFQKGEQRLFMQYTSGDVCEYRSSVNDIVPLPDLQGEYVSDVCAGADCLVVLTESRRVFVYGKLCHGLSGDGDRAVILESHLFGSILVKVRVGESHALVLDAEGCLYGWGSNKHHQLGFLSLEEGQHHVPLKIFTCVKDMGAGHSYSVALTVHGSVYIWNGSYHNVLQLPAPAKIFLEKPVSSFACGRDFIFFLLEDMSLYFLELNYSKSRFFSPRPELKVFFSEMMPYKIQDVKASAIHVYDTPISTCTFVTCNGIIYACRGAQQTNNGELAPILEESDCSMCETRCVTMNEMLANHVGGTGTMKDPIVVSPAKTKAQDPNSTIKEFVKEINGHIDQLSKDVENLEHEAFKQIENLMQILEAEREIMRTALKNERKNMEELYENMVQDTRLMMLKESEETTKKLEKARKEMEQNMKVLQKRLVDVDKERERDKSRLSDEIQNLELWVVQMISSSEKAMKNHMEREEKERKEDVRTIYENLNHERTRISEIEGRIRYGK